MRWIGPEKGVIHLATAACGNELVYYGIHALELAYAVLGRGAVSCLNVGQPGRNIVRVRFDNRRGLLLMVGATGTGKSTTLASMLEWRNQQITGHILTIEDPIEFVHARKNCLVSQREVGVQALGRSGGEARDVLEGRVAEGAPAPVAAVGEARLQPLRVGPERVHRVRALDDPDVPSEVQAREVGEHLADGTLVDRTPRGGSGAVPDANAKTLWTGCWCVGLS